MTTIGIDPGLGGAIAVILPDGSMRVHDMPTFMLERNGKKKREIDCVKLAAIIRDVDDCSAVVWLEQVGSMPGQGVSSVFAFGQAFGIVKGIVAALGQPLELVTPQVWKKALRVPKDKDGARARASQIMPGMASNWPLAKHDGRAEAALIAYYGDNMNSPFVAKELW
jgi:crossover junction endodeoxyribonuclease RuvC